MNKYFWYMLMFGLIIMWAYNSEAARPFATDDAGTVPAGGYELEAGYDWGEEEGVFGVGFKHGLTEKMDIGVGFGYRIETEPENSFTPAELSLKFALIPDLLAVSFAHEFGDDSAYTLNSSMTKIFGPVEVSANLGYEATGDEEDGLTIYALSLILASGENFDIGAELLGDEDDLQNLLIGARYHIKEGFSIDAGFSKGIGDDIDDMVTAGFHYEF
jgi:hypothetical protein